MPDLAPPRVEPEVRVRIARLSSPERGTTVAPASGNGWLRAATPDRPSPERVLAGPVSVLPESGGWTVVDATGLRTPFEGDVLEIGAVRDTTATVRVGETPYPGTVRFVARSSDGPGVVDVVNHVPMEAYLPGVLARELFANWHLEAFRAQAVAARSFACTEIAFWRGRRHFDVVAGQASQAYVGSTANANALRGVRDTRGVVLAWRGGVVPAYYSSCCGGASASAVDAISDHPMNDIAPLAARPAHECCRAAPVWSWASEQGDREAAQRLVAWSRLRGDARLPALGAVVAIEPIAMQPNGRPLRFRIVDTSGASAELSAERLRWALNHADGALSPPRRPVRSGNFAVTPRRGTLQIAGRGYGHGVGMCQYGAQAFAAGGRRWDAIVAHYYPGSSAIAPYA